MRPNSLRIVASSRDSSSLLPGSHITDMAASSVQSQEKGRGIGRLQSIGEALEDWKVLLFRALMLSPISRKFPLPSLCSGEGRVIQTLKWDLLAGSQDSTQCKKDFPTCLLMLRSGEGGKRSIPAVVLSTGWVWASLMPSLASWSRLHFSSLGKNRVIGNSSAWPNIAELWNYYQLLGRQSSMLLHVSYLQIYTKEDLNM